VNETDDIWDATDGSDLAAAMTAVETFISRFVAYPTEHGAVTHTAWIAHTHAMDAWENTPRKAFLSAEPASGKSRALEVTGLLVPNTIHAINVSPAYIFRKIADEAGPPTILHDEIDTVFGPKAKDNEETRGLYNAGTRRGATSGRCVMRGKAIETEEFPAYCAVAFAGLDDLPDTIASRSIVTRMRRRAAGETVEQFRQRKNEPEGHEIRDQMADAIAPHIDVLRDAWPEMPPEVQDRTADCWEPLLAIADLAGGDWPKRLRVAAVAHVADRKANERETLGIRLLTDLFDVFHYYYNNNNQQQQQQQQRHEHLSTEVVLEKLNKKDESPWGDLRGKPLDARGLSRRLSKPGCTARLS